MLTTLEVGGELRPRCVKSMPSPASHVLSAQFQTLADNQNLVTLIQAGPVSPSLLFGYGPGPNQVKLWQKAAINFDPNIG